LEELRRDADRLVLRAPTHGTFLPPPRRSAPASDPDRLPTWTGLPTDAHNVDCYVEAGTLFGLIGRPDHLSTTLHIDQSTVEFVREGQAVEILLHADPDKVFTGRVERISKKDLQSGAPSRDKRDRVSSNRADADTSDGPRVTYEAVVGLTEVSHPIPAGARGIARIEADPQTLLERVRRWLTQSLRRRW
jgi:hypothetical protein